MSEWNLKMCSRPFFSPFAFGRRGEGKVALALPLYDRVSARGCDISIIVLLLSPFYPGVSLTRGLCRE